jgi:hypothetical protein
MQALNSFQTLLQRIDEYRKRYFLNQLVKGGLIFLALLFTLYLTVNAAEFFGRFGSGIRAFLFFGFLAFLIAGALRWIVSPLLNLYGLRKPLSDEDAARQIGNLFPGQVGDKLLNTLQLQQLSSQQNELLMASLNQRSEQLLITRFSNAIRLDKNREYLKYAIPPLVLILGVLAFNPSFFTKSSTRLVQYNQEFAEEAPFRFVVLNKSLKAFRNEDFVLTVRLTGSALPQTAYLVSDGTRFKLEKSGNDDYSYTFDNVQRDLNFRLDAAGFQSNAYTLELVDRPSILNFDVQLTYPAYLNKPAEQLANVGNLLVPQGTVITWNFLADHTDSLAIRFMPGNQFVQALHPDNNAFKLTKQVNQSSTYSISLHNQQARNAGELQYNIQVIPDRFPQISVAQSQDSITYNFVGLSGLINDDYGFSQLKLVASIERQGGGKAVSFSRPIPINRATNSQNFVFNWSLDSLQLKPSDRITYYVQVWDNDGINGPKSSRTPTLNFTIPSSDEIQKQVEKSAEKTEQQIEEALAKSKSIKKELSSIEERMRTKKATDFQDKKQLQDVLKKRQELMEDIQKLKEQFQKTSQTQERFAENNEKLQEKMAQLEKLFNEMSDPEAKKLFEELKQLMDKKQDDKASELLERMSRKERNMEKELERALKMFKQFKQDQKMEKLIEDLKKQADQQDKQAQENAQKKTSDEAQQEQQKKAAEEFKKTKEELKAVEKNAEKEELKKPDTQEKQQEEISEQMEQTKEQMEKSEPKKASSSQSKTAKSMRSMAKAMSESMMSAEMKENMENMDDLRNLLDNLISLSFSQEKVMRDFKTINFQDPRITKLSQEQLKLQDDARVIEDSLNALAGRVAQIRSFVTREMTDMKYYMDQSVQQLKERKTAQAASRQQFAMTSMNNLALMLSDALKNMQAAMNAMSMPGSGKGGKKGNKPSPGMGEQQKELNGKMQQLSKSGKSGQGLSEELSNLAAQQAMIRKMLQQAQENAKGTELGQKMGDQMRELQEKMDQAETDLVNKRVNPQTMNRQNEILTRLLESEKAIRQQEEDPTRKAEAAKSSKQSNPPTFANQFSQPLKQVEVIRSVTPAYNPYYKGQANRYLQNVVK